MEMCLINKVITFIYVSDLIKSKKIYEEIMGFALRLDQGACRIVETNQEGGGLLGYYARDQKSAPVDNLIITLVTSSVDEWYDYLTGCGLNIPGPPKLNLNFNIYHFFFTDPDGYKLEIQEFRDSAW